MEEKIDQPAFKDTNAESFRRKNGYSITFGKLMAKYNCSTPDEYRSLRKVNKKLAIKPSVSKTAPVSNNTSKKPIQKAQPPKAQPQKKK